MNMGMKLTALSGAILAGTVFFSPSAMAQNECTAQTLAQFMADADGCRDQDKLFKGIAGNTAMADWTLSIAVDLLPGEDQHKFDLARELEPTLGIGTYTVEYTVEIVDDPTTPEDETLDRTFKEILLGVNVAGGSQAASNTNKEVWGSTDGGVTEVNLGALNVTGNQGGDGPLACAGCTWLRVVDTITKTGTDRIMSSFTNTFTQEVPTVPEPASIALLGTGIIGLALRRRRKTV